MKKPIRILQKDTVLQDSWFFPWFPQVSNSLASSDTCPAHFGRPFLGLWVTGLVRAGRPLQEVLVGHSWPCATEGNILLSSEKQKTAENQTLWQTNFLSHWFTLIYLPKPRFLNVENIVLMVKTIPMDPHNVGEGAANPLIIIPQPHFLRRYGWIHRDIHIYIHLHITIIIHIYTVYYI